MPHAGQDDAFSWILQDYMSSWALVLSYFDYKVGRLWFMGRNNC